MAKNEKNHAQGSQDMVEDGPRKRVVSGAWARTVEEGERLHGRYLGYDTIVMPRTGETRIRHFLAGVTVTDPDGVVRELDEECIFGAMQLNNDLREVRLGALVDIERKPGRDRKRRSAIYVVEEWDTAPDTRGVKGRKDLPQQARAEVNYGANGFNA